MSVRKTGQSEELAGSVAERIAGMIEAVLDNMRELIGPLTEKEEREIRTVLEYHATSVLIDRLNNLHRIGHGVDE